MEPILDLIGKLLLQWGSEIAAITVVAGLICWWISAQKEREE